MRNGRRILTAILASVLTLMLAACTSGSGSGKTNGDAPDPDKIRGEEVTEKVWKDAFDFKGVTGVTVQIWQDEVPAEEEPGDPGDVIKWVMLIQIDDNKIYTSEERGLFDAKGNRKESYELQESYLSKENGKTYRYSHPQKGDTQDMSRWEKKEDAEGSFASTAEGINACTDDLLAEWRDVFPQFTYDKQNKEYTGLFFDDITVKTKIANGKLQVIYFFQDDELWNGVQFYNYGTTKVTLPKIKDESGTGTTTPEPTDDGRVTEQEWIAAMLFGDNLTVRATYEEYPTETCIWQWDGDKRYQYIATRKIENDCVYREVTEQYFSKENDVIFVYSLDLNREWTKERDRMGNVLLTPVNVLPLGQDRVPWVLFQYYTYEKEQKAYVANLDSFTYIVKIVDGKVQEITWKDFRQGTLIAVFRFSDYGTTTVTLPKVA